jgi:hypothetical protein
LKISPLIAKYLQEFKTVNIEGFGKFFIDGNAAYAEASEKNAPVNPIQYEYSPGLVTDSAFIDYVIKETGKIRPLAIADLETYISLAKQLLNISKPFVIDSVGTLTKVTAGHYEFTPGNYEPPKINTDNERDRKLRQAKEVSRETEIRYSKSYDGEPKANNKALIKKVLGALTLLLLLGAAGWAVYHFIINKETNKPTATVQSRTDGKPEDTSTTSKKDTTNLTQTAKPMVKDSLGRVEYKAVIKIADSINAYERYNGLKKIDKPAVIYKADANNFKVAILLKALPQDTARVADSIHTYYLQGTKYSSFRVVLEQ